MADSIHNEGRAFFEHTYACTFCGRKVRKETGYAITHISQWCPCLGWPGTWQELGTKNTRIFQLVEEEGS